jgi:hypothetical protein
MKSEVTKGGQTSKVIDLSHFFLNFIWFIRKNKLKGRDGSVECNDIKQARREITFVVENYTKFWTRHSGNEKDYTNKHYT